MRLVHGLASSQAAFTIAKMPALMGSGRVGQADMTSIRSAECGEVGAICATGVSERAFLRLRAITGATGVWRWFRKSFGLRLLGIRAEH
jgi:hypothetical protein